MIYRTSRSKLDRIRQAAIPLNMTNRQVDPGPIMALFDGATCIGLGEPTHGDATSLRLKLAIMTSVSRNRDRVGIAWERGPAQIRLIKQAQASTGDLPPEIRRWIYPWISQEMDDVLRWAEANNSDRPGAVTLGGVDVDNLGPAEIYTEIAQALTTSDHDVVMAVADAATRAPEVLPSADVLRQIAKASRPLSELAALPEADRLILQAAGQWAYLKLLAGGQEKGHETASEYRDHCMARNLLRWRRDANCQLTFFSAHNGHISREPWMAGGHLRAALGDGYLSVGMAFAQGRFYAGTARPGGGFDRTLKLFDAQKPPPGSLEHLLTEAQLPACVVDLRPLRDTNHPLAQSMQIREVALAGGLGQFQLTRRPSEIYDMLIWLHEIEPATLIQNLD